MQVKNVMERVRQGERNEQITEAAEKERKRMSGMERNPHTILTRYKDMYDDSNITECHSLCFTWQ